MQRLRVFEAISIDGYFVDAHGDMSRALQGRDDPEFVDRVSGNASGGGALLFGSPNLSVAQRTVADPGQFSRQRRPAR